MQKQDSQWPNQVYERNNEGISIAKYNGIDDDHEGGGGIARVSVFAESQDSGVARMWSQALYPPHFVPKIRVIC